MPASPHPPSPRWHLPALLAGLVATRALYLLGAVEDVYISDVPVAGLTWAWLRGARFLDLKDLWAPYAGGDVLFQLLATPLYALLGDSILAPTVLAGLFTALGLVLVFRVARHHGGPRAALWAGLLYVMVPPGFMAIPLVGVGDHWMVALVVVLAGHLGLLALHAEQPRRQGWLLAALGLTLGLGTFIGFLSVIAWAALAPLLLLTRPRAGWGWRPVLLGLAGLALGLAPLVAYQGWHTGAGVAVRDISLAQRFTPDPLHALARAARVLTLDLSRATWFGPGLPQQLARHTWVALAWVCLLACVWGQRRALVAAALAPLRRRRLAPGRVRLEAYLLGVTLAFVGLWGLVDLPFEGARAWGYRYLVVLLPVLLLAGGLALALLGVRRPRAAIALGSAALLAAAVGMGWPADLRDPDRLVRYHGIDWSIRAHEAYGHWQGAPEAPLAEAVAVMGGPQRAAFLTAFGARLADRQGPFVVIHLGTDVLTPEDQLHLFRGLLATLTSRGFRPQGELRLIEDLARELPVSSHPLFLSQLAGAVAQWGTQPQPLEAWLRARDSEAETAWVGPLVAEAWGGALLGRAPAARALTAIPSLEDPALEARAWFGAGVRSAQRHAPPLDRLAAEVARLPEDGREPFVAGYAHGVRARAATIADPLAQLAKVAGLPHDLADPLARELGITAASSDRAPHRLAAQLADTLPPAQRPPTCEGLGYGAALGGKTANDTLRWCIHWDRFVGPGCDAAFHTGLVRGLTEVYGTTPGFLAERMAVLGLP